MFLSISNSLYRTLKGDVNNIFGEVERSHKVSCFSETSP